MAKHSIGGGFFELLVCCLVFVDGDFQTHKHTIQALSRERG